ncbi:MAG: hypothetical protein J1E81_00575 [Eubacterium sp.]|nr:hypothetical protein [Eubacterium sp.]
MAVVKFVISGSPMNNIFPYIMKKEKTEQKLISGINCMPETAWKNSSQSRSNSTKQTADSIIT